MDTLSPSTLFAIGTFASRLKSGMDTVVKTTQEWAEEVKDKTRPLADSIAENAAVVKTKSLELAENVKEKSSEVAESMKKGAVVVAENVQGRIAPKTVKREGHLTKQVNGSKWVDYYFILRDGTFQVLLTQNATSPELLVTLDCIQRAEPLDLVVTGKPYCFRVTILLIDKPETIVNNWAFFGSNTTSNKVNNQEVDVILQALDEEEMKGWVRELYSTSSGLSMQESVKKTSEGALESVKKTSEGAMESMKKTGEGAMTFMGTIPSLVGLSEDKSQQYNL